VINPSPTRASLRVSSGVQPRDHGRWSTDILDLHHERRPELQIDHALEEDPHVCVSCR
jgi:hypothetical protein